MEKLVNYGLIPGQSFRVRELHGHWSLRAMSSASTNTPAPCELPVVKGAWSRVGKSGGTCIAGQ
jgi:hypothetical protein